MVEDLYYFICRVCGHSVVPSFRLQHFHHYDRSDRDTCRHDCHVDMQIEASRLPPVEWVLTHRLEEGRISRFVVT